MRFTPKGRRAASVAIGIVVFGVSASILVVLSVASNQAAEREHWLAERGEVVEATTADTVGTAIDGLSAVAAFFENSHNVDPDEFEGFVASLDPVIRLIGVGYVSVVAADGLDAQIARMQETVPGYSVTSFDAAGESQPVSRDRETYYPVEMFQSGPLVAESVDDPTIDVNAVGLGYDVGSPEAWRPSLELSVTDDTPAISAFVDVGAGETMLGNAFIVSVPVHDAEGAVVGVVVAPMMDFLLATEVDLAITKSVSWAITTGETASAIDGESWEATIELPGIAWDLVVVPTDGALVELGQTSPLVVLLAGVALTTLVTYLFLAVGQRSRARGEVEEMGRLADEKDRFLASVSHEIRTPLTVVSGLAHELRDRPQAFQGAEGGELLTMIARQSDEVAAIVEDLLVATRADLGKVSIIRGIVDLEREAAGVLESTGVEAEIVGDRTRAWTDASRVRQILRNLVTNAGRYGGPEKEIRLGSEGVWAWIDVVDSGPPIPKEENSEQEDRSARGLPCQQRHA